MLRVAAVGLVTAMLAVGPACTKKKKDAPKQPPAEPAAAQTPDPGKRLRGPAPVRPNSPKSLGQRRRIEPIAIDELTATVDVPDGAKVLTPPSKPKVGERVQTTYCFENTEVKAAADTIKASLEAKGWSPVHLRFRDEQPDRAAVASQKDTYRVSASVQRAAAPECEGRHGHAYVTVTMHKLTRVAPRPGSTP